MTSNKSKLSVRVQGDIRERLRTFQAEHQLKSLSGAIGVILENYFETISSVPSEVEQADVLPASDSMTNILLKRIEKLETRLVETEKHSNELEVRLVETEKHSNELEVRLAVAEAELGNYRRTASTQGLKSLKPIQASTKPHNSIYGRGEAASIYPGWELSANVSYVFSRIQTLNTDEARAAFADKWIGLCAQSIDTAWVVCYQLLSIIKEKQMYKIPQWMEGNKTYDSFSDYFEQRFKQPFEKWLQLERTYKFVVETCPELLEGLLHLESSPDFSRTVEAQNDSGNGVIPSKTKRKTRSPRSQKLPQPEAQPEAQPEQPLDSVETASMSPGSAKSTTQETLPTPEAANQVENDSGHGVIPSKTKRKTRSRPSQKLPQPEAQPEAQPEQPLDSVETASMSPGSAKSTTQETLPTPEAANQVEKDSDVQVTPDFSGTVAQKLETQESSTSDPLSEIMTTREISELLNWHRDKLEGRKKRGNLPIQEGGYVIDCIGKEGRKLIWTVKRLK